MELVLLGMSDRWQSIPRTQKVKRKGKLTWHCKAWKTLICLVAEVCNTMVRPGSLQLPWYRMRKGFCLCSQPPKPTGPVYSPDCRASHWDPRQCTLEQRDHQQQVNTHSREDHNGYSAKCDTDPGSDKRLCGNASKIWAEYRIQPFSFGTWPWKCQVLTTGKTGLVSEHPCVQLLSRANTTVKQSCFFSW